MRSISKFGLSQVVVTFKDGTDIYFGRQLITERLATVELAQGIERPKMGPVATGLGEVFHYVVREAGKDVTAARTIHDWVIKPKMRTVKGVAEINGWGGYEKQYQVRIDPTLLIKYGLTFDQVMQAIEQNNQNVGGGMVHQGTQAVLVQGLGRTAQHRRRSKASSSHRSMACRSAWATWPTSPSAPKSAAAPSPPTAKAKS